LVVIAMTIDLYPCRRVARLGDKLVDVGDLFASIRCDEAKVATFIGACADFPLPEQGAWLL